MKLVSVGTVAFDAIETPFGKTDKIVGGACTYISLSASYFNDNPKLISVVGDDFPKETIDLFHSKNIDTEGLQIKEGEKTFFWSGKYHQDMNSRDTIDTQLNVLETFDPIVPESYFDCDILMLGNLTPAVQLNVIKQLPRRPKLIALDTMDFWMQIALDDLLAVIKEIDVLTINDEEARLLSGEFSLKKAANKILTMGPTYLIIKKGEHGALLFDKNNNVFSAPALLLEEVFDPTGAGDTFAGGFMGYLSSQDEITWESMKKAIIVGSAMASFTVEKFGIERIKGLNKEEIDNRINQFKEMTSF
ncbi:MAG: sugar kinase [Crocinitomicaceae bacterium]|nr:sugar kinase [Crocinitomicaceae bacterium]|tara:strand:+ start:9341 stop:10252 length:912 start_codon:yes stop_codon:yes gene_type:complete